MSWLLALHLLFGGLWLGCVLTEALFERALLGKGRDKELILARLHWKVDLAIEIPAILGVIATGFPLWRMASDTNLLSFKIAAALVAILANLWCVKLVRDRLHAGEAGDWDRFAQLDHRQHQVGAIVLVGIVVAAGLGLANLT